LVSLHRISNGTFDPSVGRLLAAWGVHGSITLPTSTDLESARFQSGLHHLSFSPEECLLTKRRNILLDSGAFGKGEALDRVRAYSEENGSDPWLINLGGQVAVHGHPPGNAFWQVDISSPMDRERPHTTLNLARGSLATSGNSERSESIEGFDVGHILDPRTGRPSPFSGSVTVWHKEGLVADALSTALHVMGPDIGLEWADLNEFAVCYISVSESGHIEIEQSRLFDRLVLP
jgi:thiamine biosynthesis lipoprotein